MKKGLTATMFASVLAVAALAQDKMDNKKLEGKMESELRLLRRPLAQ